MTDHYPYRLIGICPAEARAACNALADTAPFGSRGAVFSVPLSATGAPPATHYGCHAWAQGAFIAQCETDFAVLLAEYGVEIWSVYDGTGEQQSDFWARTLAERGLQVVTIE